MPARLVLVLLAIATIGFFSCSKGIGNNRRNRTPVPAVAASSNLPVGVDVGPLLSAPAGEPAIAGVVVPGIGNGAPREVALLAFTTAAASNDADGGGTPLSRDATADSNGATDVFVAVVSAQDVETRAFSQSLAGKFRHPRCVTCHSMQSSTTTAFVSAALIGFQHQGPLPGPLFPNNDPTTCAPCHVAGTAFPVPTWQAPAASFDMRTNTVAQLVARANTLPIDELEEHFFTDARVLWALDSGILPTIGGNNGVADDDQDGIDEPEDRDGTPRPVPGGSVAFLQEIEDWIASGKVPTAAAAVKDVTLASRAFGTTNAGNGASARPRVLWVPNPGFDPASAVTAAASNPIGTLFVAFQSEAGNLVLGDGNGVSDVFRAAVELRAEEDVNGAFTPGALNLAFVNNSTLLCSAINATLNPGNGPSTHAEIGGDNGQVVAFQSLATNLVGGFVDGNGAGADVFVRRTDTVTTLLVSHQAGDAATGGSGASEAPSLDATGAAIAFESDATDLIAGDTNTVRDVFHARVDTGSPFTKVRSSVSDTGAEGTGGASSAASVHFTAPDRVLVAFESDKTDLAPVLDAPTNVFLFDSATGNTTLLNQLVSPTETAIGNGSARAPKIAPSGLLVAFASESSNIDVLRPGDLNRAADIYLIEVPQVEAGNVVPFRVSMTATSAADADGASTAPALGTFAEDSAFPAGVVAYSTLATNLGTSDTTKLMVSFLSETSGVFANFTTSTALGGPPLEVQFTDTSTGDPTSWQWDFDNDGTIDSTEQNPLFTFTTPGTYDVKLVAANTRGSGTKIVPDAVRVLGPCVANFTASGTNGQPPFQVTFTDTSTELPTQWEWDFGDGGTSTQQNPTHTYTVVGVYTVSLTATGPGGSGTETKTDFITVVFLPPNVTIVPSVSSGTNPLTVNFSFTNSGGPISSVAWNFGDPGSGANNTSTLSSPSHTFSTVNTFTVTLTATGPGGQDVDTQPILVSNAPPNVTIVPDVTSGVFPLTVDFTFNNSGGPISGVVWNFGDPGSGGNNTSTAAAPSHTFNTAGNFTVTLTATGPGGQDIDTQPIVVNTPPAPNITVVANLTNGTVPLTVSFSVNNSGGPISTFAWNFDDPGSGGSNTSSSSAPSHTFNSAGNFSVQLTATGPGGQDIDAQLIVASITWTQVYAAINSGAAGCTVCHASPPINGAPFSMGTQGTAFTNLVGVVATTGSCAGTLQRVNTFDAANSAIVRRVQGGTCGLQMTGLTATQITRLIAWINAGALNN